MARNKFNSTRLAREGAAGLEELLAYVFTIKDQSAGLLYELERILVDSPDAALRDRCWRWLDKAAAKIGYYRIR